MTKHEKKLVADARQFVEQTYADVDGRVPSRKAVEMAAKEIASVVLAVQRDVDPDPSKRRRS